MCSRICEWKKLSHIYSIQNSPIKEMLYLHNSPFCFMLTADLYADVRLSCSLQNSYWRMEIYLDSLQYSLLSDVTTFLSHIADTPCCILCKLVSAHGDSVQCFRNLVVVWHFFLWNLNVCYRVHKSMPIDPILSPLNLAMPYHSISLRYVLMSLQLRIDLSSGQSSGFHTRMLYVLFFLHVCHMHCFSLLLDFITRVIFGNQ